MEHRSGTPRRRAHPCSGSTLAAGVGARPIERVRCCSAHRERIVNRNVNRSGLAPLGLSACFGGSGGLPWNSTLGCEPPRAWTVLSIKPESALNWCQPLSAPLLGGHISDGGQLPCGRRAG